MFVSAPPCGGCRLWRRVADLHEGVGSSTQGDEHCRGEPQDGLRGCGCPSAWCQPVLLSATGRPSTGPGGARAPVLRPAPSYGTDAASDLTCELLQGTHAHRVRAGAANPCPPVREIGNVWDVSDRWAGCRRPSVPGARSTRCSRVRRRCRDGDDLVDVTLPQPARTGPLPVSTASAASSKRYTGGRQHSAHESSLQPSLEAMAAATRSTAPCGSPCRAGPAVAASSALALTVRGAALG
jgi:hypothetical protein